MIEPKKIKRAVSFVMQASDDFALRITYRAKDGSLTRRYVSPVRFQGQDQFMALCLCREQPRCFRFDKVEDAVMVHSSDILMPVEIEVLEPAKPKETKREGKADPDVGTDDDCGAERAEDRNAKDHQATA